MERERIIASEITSRKELITKKKNDFVEAGAGAGKTYSLITRIFHQLTREEGQVEPKEVVAITFTNKAAEELRVRIVGRLKRKEETELEEKRLFSRKKDLLRTIDQMQISTIHKFCDNILKENAIQAGLSPDYQIIMNEAEEDRKKETIRRFFKKFIKEDWEKYSLLCKTNREIKENIVRCFNELLVNVNHLTKEQIFFYELDETALSLYNECESSLRAFIHRIYDIYSEYEAKIIAADEADRLIAEQDNKNFNGTVKTDYTDLFNDFSSKYKEVEFFFVDYQRYKIEIPFNKTRFKKIIDDGDTIYSELEELLNNYKKANYKISIFKNNLFLHDAYDLYHEYLKDADNDIAHLTNNDLIYHTYKLLSEHPEVVNKLQNKIKHLYIDEYQDTDSVQYQIAKLIAGNREDCLYLVGDPKQSIYRFRGAEPDVFFETKQVFLDDKEHKSYDTYSLNINFRSNSEILKWVNEQYSSDGKNIRLVSDPHYEYGEMLYADRNLINDNEKSSDHLIGFYSFDGSNPKDISRLIKHLVDNKLLRRVKGDKDNFSITYEKIKYSDIMLLFQGHKKMPPYINQLAKDNIPTRVFGSIDFSETFALRTFVNLFDVLNTNSNSNLAIAESVFTNIYPARYENKTLKESHELTESLINSLRKETKNMSSYGKAIYLIEHLDLLMPEGYEAYYFELNTFVSKLYQMVEEVFSKGFINGSEILVEFRNYLEVAVERESSIKKDDDAVMMINLHKAKGLEKPIVIWASITKRDNTRKSSAFYKGKFYYSDLISDILKYDPTNTSLADIYLEEDYEKARLEYVAVTRPGEAFIFAQGAEYKKGLFNSSSRPYKHTDLPKIYADEDIEENEAQSIAIKKKYESSSHAYEKGSTSNLVITSPSSLENNVSETRMKLKMEAGEIKPSYRPASNNVGTILHRALELIVKENVDDSSAVTLAINENLDVVSDIDLLRPFILTCVKEYRKFFKAHRYDEYQVYPEFTFSYKSDDNTINNGSIDLLLVKENEFIIIDYKSDEAEYIKDDAVFETTLKEKYEPQLLAYEKVVKDIFKATGSVAKKIIYFRRYDYEKQSIEVKEYNLK